MDTISEEWPTYRVTEDLDYAGEAERLLELAETYRKRIRPGMHDSERDAANRFAVTSTLAAAQVYATLATVK